VEFIQNIDTLKNQLNTYRIILGKWLIETTWQYCRTLQ